MRSELLQKAPNNWQVINLAPTYPQKNIKKDFILFKNSRPGWGAWAYAINRKGMKQLLDKTYEGTDITVEKGRDQVSDMLIYKNTISYEYYGQMLFYLMNHQLPSTIDSTNLQYGSINQTYNALLQYNL